MAVKRSQKTRKTARRTKDLDLISGRLNLREHVEEKRKELQAERGEYEKKYLSRYKEPKTSARKSSNLQSDVDLGKLNLGQYINAKRKTKQD